MIAGVATSIGVESTARQAHEPGFNVTLAVDAMTDLNADAHTTASPGSSRGSARTARPRKSSRSSNEGVIDSSTGPQMERSGEAPSARCASTTTASGPPARWCPTSGTWMQRTAQDWLVLTELTHKNATARRRGHGAAVRAAAAAAAPDGLRRRHLDRRKMLIATQALMGVLALGLGMLTLTGIVRLWHVYLFAFLLGCVSAFDAPARQTFVSELVGEDGPVERGGAELHLVQRGAHDRSGRRRRADRRRGPGWVFLINAASFVAVLGSLCGFCASSSCIAMTRRPAAAAACSKAFATSGAGRTSRPFSSCCF